MKIWLKLLIGSGLGITIGMLLPSDSENVQSAFLWIERLALGIGRYAVVPVLVFSLTMSVFGLRRDGKFWKMVLNNLLFIFAASVIVVFSGIIMTLIFSPGRIPIERVDQIEILTLGTIDNILDIFPSNMFSVLVGNGIYLFPIFAFAFFLGMGLNEKAYSKPVISIIDSLSRVFYNVASFFSEILGFIIIMLSAYWAYRYSAVLQLNVYRDLIVLLGLFSIVLCFVIFPLFLYFLKPRVNPWRVLYGSLGPAIAAFFSGDINLSLPILQRHSKENFGVRRRSGVLSLALFSTFCRCGSSMVAASAFIVIIRSYSYLSITPSEVFSIAMYALGFSFLLARHPGSGAYVALAALCVGYGGGEYSAGYLLLKPLAFFLIAVGTFIDVMLTAYGSFFVAKANGYIKEKEQASYI